MINLYDWLLFEDEDVKIIRQYLIELKITIPDYSNLLAELVVELIIGVMENTCYSLLVLENKQCYVLCSYAYGMLQYFPARC